jgi:hypothetical protein
MQSDIQMDELQLLSTVDPTRRLEYDLLDAGMTWRLEERAKQCRRRRLSFALAVRKGRSARYSLLIGSRYGVWSVAERRFIRTTNLYHYHCLTQGIRDVREIYLAVLFDPFDVRSFAGFLYKVFVVNCYRRRTALILRAQWFYYHAFMVKDRRMECWHDDVYGGEDKREEMSSLRHRLVDVYRRRMTPAQRQRALVMYQRDRRDISCFLGFILLVLLALFAFVVRLLNYCWRV